ncbi:methylmalonyl-CoA mutase [Desulfosarcina alkanivorans]|uniref:Methylmalonyl-CoA mutase n=1 Tax=Desulfosarcina alkanivorans TaxID=571177 RepID=A0A5K7YTQ9_9BACT|nr:cobalamin B12-binding domain-containing protein [Desulfosarcina alkanivorans]BBO68047.1 methylmalonyl-CoA mutase [Desulfosarcina alkanivorans]
MDEKKKIRVLIAKPGLDGHERGARVIAYGLRDLGFEVIYTGLRQTTDQIVTAAIQEDVNVVGLSILSGAHISLTRKVLDQLRERDAGDVMVIIGGIVPEKDHAELSEMGVAGIFTAGSAIKDVAAFIRSKLA